MRRGSHILLVAFAIAIVVMTAAVVALVVTSNSGGDSPDDCSNVRSSGDRPDGTGVDRSACVPGTFVPSQGRAHFAGAFASHTPTPFCDDVLHAAPSGAPIATGASPAAMPSEIPTNCYLSNPPSSGKHLNVQRNVDVGNGNQINIPPDPNVYPDDIDVPRDAIPHILEHAGVFVGWNCAPSSDGCMATIAKLKTLVNGRIDNHDNRVVMAHDADLVPGTIGLASWTRVLTVAASDYDARSSEIENFIAKNSCRFDPEGFCR